ncbi:flagellar motor switch protein FliG [Vulcaniibacterium thermophilum]|uniref:Flagellar motor switch protein FliG n=1 Tax=Vulcaniibacterium thermophilum TaxID=1169913 RepID=A0A918Z4I9_9GAMM|nr:flagellar motor switch protein FliG [Vulcaniibacterium thermophilum]GHE37481.1 flagellar motor switch protein FliG [Vulcaniibacterium thermophilum]
MADGITLSGVQRAAVLLMSLGESDAAEVLKHLGAKEVQKLGMAMATIGNVTRQQVEEVVDEFVASLEDQTSLGVGADDYVRKVLVQALGEDKAASLIDRILFGRNTKGLDTLKWMEPRAVAELIRNEHPQIISIVLAHLDPDQSAEVLKSLPERTRADVLLRIATLDGIPPNALHELNEIMERQFSGQNNLKSSSVGGVKLAANIINQLDTSTEQAVMALIRDIDQDLGSKIQDLMFVFDDLGELDDRAMQALLREVPQDRLGLALRGADPRVKDKVLANMSQRAAQILVEDMEARGPVRLSDVEAAQKEILGIARKLADEGTIVLGPSASEAFV